MLFSCMLPASGVWIILSLVTDMNDGQMNARAANKMDISNSAVLDMDGKG